MGERSIQDGKVEDGLDPSEKFSSREELKDSQLIAFITAYAEVREKMGNVAPKQAPNYGDSANLFKLLLR